MKENKFLEFKSNITNTFLKTVSAFSNIGTGVIRFGYNDEGNICPLEEELSSFCLELEKQNKQFN